ncbi:protein transport protein Sec24A-like isoform X1 [Toxorhynchites rutilus septentrionalis]|uniref:protein transport protein Sec24A-like isoform X1 n=1 Tax=Toxorhynchites rutilus septentrionalis TaxID=329112 RepID=UPI00247A5083|nr:protein transport protein Sec24A-like isoform X1 [Toxorhynchites rutilus septentrionalis]XP_055621355.1 protein transport protein Sec24A-like isoform X1 [Toxorhynchites rutilus septentrionalis]
MMPNPSQYYGMPNGHPSSANGLQQQIQQYQSYPPSSQQQQVMLAQQQYPVKNAINNGPPNAAAAAVATSVSQPHGVHTAPPLQNGPSMVQNPQVNTNLPQQQPHNRITNLIYNGNSAVSSRTSSPLPVNNSIPASQMPPSVSSRSNIYPAPSSQSQQLGMPVVSSNSLSANNNGTGGNNTNFVNTPPKTASGLSTPLNSSTPNLSQPSLNGPVSNLTTSMQQLNVNRPPSAQQQINGAGIPQNPVPYGGYRSQTTQLPPTKQSNVQQTFSMPPTSAYGQPPLHSNQYGQPLNGNHLPNNSVPSQSQQQSVSYPNISAQSVAGSTTASAVTPVMSATPALNKRPLYPAQTMPPAPTYQAPGYNPNQQAPYQAQQYQPLYQQSHQQQNHHQHPQQQHPPSANLQQQHPDPQYSVLRSGFNKLWGNNTVDLLQNRHILPTEKVRPPTIHLNQPFHEATNCNPDIFRCTLTKIPETNQLLQKSRLPLGVLIHPFRDLNNLPVISCNTIVRCRVCRTYINPFVFFVDSKKWKCNLCYRVNELPEEFQFDPVTKTYGDPTRRPEIKSSTIEFIAPSEYMLRPPQPAIYLFLLDVSSIAQQTGYLHTVCNTLVDHLESLPGDARTQVGFIAYNSAIHFYNIAEGYSQPHEVTVLDVEDVFLPYPDNLLVNLKECKELIKDLLTQLPKRFEHTHDTHSALGAALQVAFKLMSASGGRVTVFQCCLPNYGPGALQSREDPNNRSSKDVAHLGPATDFYKRLALDCSAQQIAVDLFLLNSQYCDLATISGISKFSGGCMQHIPLFSAAKPQLVKSLQKCFERYLTRKIGFEAVMRVRCTRGLAIHTFHGNFFVRSTDLLSLPNVNPDAGFGMQLTYEESLAECKTVCFQAALLYTSSKAERRIRVHTLCIPVTSSLSEVMYSADAQCIVGLLSKMAVDRSLSSSLSDARDAFINATVDIFSAFKIAQNLPQNSGTIVAPENLALLPLYILAMLKHTAFRVGTSTRLDDRVFAMSEMKTMPLDQLIRYIYPDFYVLDELFLSASRETTDGEAHLVEPPRLQLSAEKFDSRSMFLLDCGPEMFIYVGSNVAPAILSDIIGVNSVPEIPDFCIDLPSRETAASEALFAFIDSINEEKPYSTYIQVIRDTSQFRSLFVEKFVDDRNQSSLSYYEFLQHLRTQVK